MSAIQQVLISFKAATSGSVITFTDSVTAGSSTGNSVTTVSKTTPANFHGTFAVAYDDFGGAPVISDSYTNNWSLGGSPLTIRSGSAVVKLQFYFCENASGGAGHTFTATGSFNYPSIAIVWCAGVKTSSSFDQEAGAGAAAVTSQDMGSTTTPSVTACLIITALALNNTATPTVPTGYSNLTGTAGDAANHIGCFIATKIQVGAAVGENPSWAWSGATIAAGALADFKPA